MSIAQVGIARTVIAGLLVGAGTKVRSCPLNCSAGPVLSANLARH